MISEAAALTVTVARVMTAVAPASMLKLGRVLDVGV
jgi:hypothetical protein